MKKLGVILLGALLLFSPACEKEGPAGPQGPAGSTGATGPAGQNGQDGNANVTSTLELTVSSWTAIGTQWEAHLTVPDITQDIVNTGMVKVFRKYGDEWWALPDMNGTNTTQYGFSVGNVTLLNADMDGSATPNPGSMIFRVVTISSHGIATNPGIDWNNYQQIKQLF